MNSSRRQTDIESYHVESRQVEWALPLRFYSNTLPLASTARALSPLVTGAQKSARRNTLSSASLVPMPLLPSLTLLGFSALLTDPVTKHIGQARIHCLGVYFIHLRKNSTKAIQFCEEKLINCLFVLACSAEIQSRLFLDVQNPKVPKCYRNRSETYFVTLWTFGFFEQKV